MKKILLAVAGVVVIAVAAYAVHTKFSSSTKAESKTTSGLTVCDGKYALCAAST